MVIQLQAVVCVIYTPCVDHIISYLFNIKVVRFCYIYTEISKFIKVLLKWFLIMI